VPPRTMTRAAKAGGTGSRRGAWRLKCSRRRGFTLDLNEFGQDRLQDVCASASLRALRALRAVAGALHSRCAYAENKTIVPLSPGSA
jgi:hypothetical protein